MIASDLALVQTYSTVLTCIMAMALHPDKLHKAQAELDEVVGTERMPTISDKASLPYVNALIKETMRWHPALPLSMLPNPLETSGAGTGTDCSIPIPLAYRYRSLHF